MRFHVSVYEQGDQNRYKNRYNKGIYCVNEGEITCTELVDIFSNYGTAGVYIYRLFW